MEKKRLSQILAKADAATVAALAEVYRAAYDLTVIKAPHKTLTMVQLREPVKSSLFYAGEVIVTEAVVSLDGTRGIAVIMGDDFEKTLNMAILDAAHNSGLLTDEATLRDLEADQLVQEQRDNALHLKTMVRFNSMDTEATE